MTGTRRDHSYLVMASLETHVGVIRSETEVSCHAIPFSFACCSPIDRHDAQFRYCSWLVAETQRSAGRGEAPSGAVPRTILFPAVRRVVFAGSRISLDHNHSRVSSWLLLGGADGQFGS